MLRGHAYAISACSASSDSTAPAPPSVAGELMPHSDKDYLGVEPRCTQAELASRLYIRTGDARLPYADFQRSIGDEQTRALVYPVSACSMAPLDR